jgi:hypothetical protein
MSCTNHVLAFHHNDKRPEIISLKEERLFWLMISEVSVHDHSTSLLWACGGTGHYGKRVWQRRLVHFMAAGRVPASPSRVHPQSLNFSKVLQAGAFGGHSGSKL